MNGFGKFTLAVCAIAAVGGAVWLLAPKEELGVRRRPPCDGIGDPDMDGWITQQDIEFVTAIIAGTITPSDEELRRADVNGDGVLNSQDLLIVNSYLLGNIGSFPVCG